MTEELVVDEKGEIVKDLPQEEPNEQLDAPVEEDIRLTADTEDHEDDTPDVDPEREAIRQRRREERRHKKEAQREREETMRRELAARDEIINQMASRLDAVERRSTGSEVAQIDNELTKTTQAISYYEEQMRLGVEAADGRAVQEANRQLRQLERRAEQLGGIKKAMTNQRTTPPPLDPRVATNAKLWHERNNWYDPNGGDEDSFIMRQLDQRLASEGWNPATPQYFEELDARAKKYLPHRYKSGYSNTQNANTRPKSPVSGSGRESSGGTNGGTYRLSADRVAALRDAGIEPGTPEFAKSVQYYKNFDKQQSAAN